MARLGNPNVLRNTQHRVRRWYPLPAYPGAVLDGWLAIMAEVSVAPGAQLQKCTAAGNGDLG